MANENPAVNAQPAAVEPVKTPTISTEDLEAKVAALEAEKAKAIEEAANYKLGMLKAKGKIKEEEVILDETEEEKIRRIAREEAVKAKIFEIDTQKEALAAKALKENKELKLALSNKGVVPVSIGAHTEGVSVQDTLVTNEQVEAFKKRGWTDKDIERYKTNLRKNSIR